MSEVMRFRRLKHGDPQKFKVLPEDVGRSHDGPLLGKAPGMLGVVALVGVSLGLLLLVGGVLG